MSPTPLANKLAKGVLFAIEGIDGAGKSTQTLRLKDYLERKGYSTLLLHEPTEGKWGKKIRRIAETGRESIPMKTQFKYFFEDRKEDVEKNIRPALDANKIVIMDRYYFSNVAYQGTDGIDPHYILQQNEKIAPKPDLTIILDVAPEAALARIKNHRISKPNFFEKPKYLGNVREQFQKLGKRSDVQIIDASRLLEEVAKHIINIIMPMINKFELEHNSNTLNQLTIYDNK